jgi:hypothetical protein
MLKHKRSKHQTYQDGWGTVWKVEDRLLTEVRQAVVHFQDQTVGERRFWDAYVSGTEISRAVKVPFETEVERGDVIVINGEQFEIVQKDLKDDRMPLSWLLSLMAVPIAYREAE